MAMNAYTGIMGSGKTFEVVQNVILPALLAGRRIVTNVAGLQIEEIYAYLIEKFDADPAKLGTILSVSNEQVPSPNFFPIEAKAGVEPVQSVVQGGDLVVMDECWRWWATGCRIMREHMEFFRMHRHFVNEATKATCDVVLVVQDIGDLDRKIKVVVENTYRMTKHKALGSTKRYRVDVYAGYKMAKGTPKIREMQRTYDPQIFKLYSSYSQSSVGGKEGVIDKRATLWSGLLFTFVLPVMLLLVLIASFFVWRFFHPGGQSPAAKASPAAAPDASSLPGAGPGPQPAPSGESEWRVKGHYSSSGRHVVVLVRGEATQLLINPVGFFYDGLFVTGSYQGHTVTNYTGSDASESRSSILGKR